MDTETRFNDTFKTIESIRLKVPNSFIILSESSPEKLAKNKLDLLRPKVDRLLILSDIPLVQDLGNKFLKSSAETLNLSLAFDFIKSFKLPNVKRIFKLTGRGELADEFDISYYENPELIGKYVFKKRITSWNDPQKSLVSTRCWSFCYSLFDETHEMLARVFNGCMYVGPDVEHVIFSELDLTKLVEKDMVHFKCQISRTGLVEYD
jgi:hypothetical protein